MKFSAALLVLASTLAIGQSQSLFQSAGIKVVRTYCEATIMPDLRVVHEVRAGNFTAGDEDEKMKKYAFCVYKTIGMATPEGDGNKEAGLKLIYPPTEPAKFEQSYDACSNQTGATPHEKFWKFLCCYNLEYPGDIAAL